MCLSLIDVFGDNNCNIFCYDSNHCEQILELLQKNKFDILQRYSPYTSGLDRINRIFGYIGPNSYRLNINWADTSINIDPMWSTKLNKWKLSYESEI